MVAMTYDCWTDQWAWRDAEKSPMTSSLCNLSISTVKTKHTISSAPSKHPDVFSPTSHSDLIWSWSCSSATHRGVCLSVYCPSQSVSQLWPSRELGVGLRGKTEKTTIKFSNLWYDSRVLLKWSIQLEFVLVVNSAEDVPVLLWFIWLC